MDVFIRQCITFTMCIFISQLSHNIAPLDYIRVAVHKLIPGCALPDVSVDMHIQACKPSSAFLSMTHEVIARHIKVCYNHVRINQAEYLYKWF